MSFRTGGSVRFWTAAAAVLFCAAAGQAQVNYVGHDRFVGPAGPFPNSNAARANWTTAASGLGTINLINFESPPVPGPAATTYTTLNLGSGVTLTANVPARPFTIANNGTPLPENSANGFNITPAGAIRCSLVGNPINSSISYTFSFATPIQAFSLHANGEGNTVQGGTLSLNFSDPAPKVTPMPSTIGSRFAGFTDAGQSISSVTFTFGVGAGGNVQPFISLDDIRWVHIGTPPPACAPNAAGTGCTNTCPAGSVCVPIEITVLPGGTPHVTKCGCVTSDTECHIGLDAANQIICLGTCPIPGETCTTKTVAWPDGSIVYSCSCSAPHSGSNCDPVTACNPDMPGSCTKVCTGECPSGYICIPKKITVPLMGLPAITDCDCVPEDAIPCHPIVLANGAIGCTGGCSGTETCVQYTINNSDGSKTYGCCCPSVHGACCIPSPLPPGMTCVITHECECAAAGGTYQGNGSTCTPNPCGPVVEEGACCNVQGGGPGGPSGTCVITTAALCVAPDVWLGPGTNCGPPNPCLPTGACCVTNPFTGGSCVVVNPQTCHDLGGMFMGPGVPCTPSPCPPSLPAGACCVIDDAGQNVCVIVTAVQCDTIGGHYYGNGSSCTPPPAGPPQCSVPDECQCENPCFDRAPVFNDSAYATFTGEVAAMTMYSPAGTGVPVVRMVNVKNRATAPFNTDWLAATLYSNPTWTADPTGVGSVFGVTVDRRGHTYVAASTCYNQDDIGLSGSLGTVYKITNGTGAISVFANLPNSGATGLGNVDYDGTRDQYFVTNMEDGRIYRINTAGVVLSTFDHATGTISAGGAAEPGDVTGYVPLGELIWGVGTFQNRVYYSVWSEDVGRPSATAANTIRSIALNGSGDFTGASQLEITMPPRPFPSGSAFYSNPVADISFSKTACMLLSERSMSNETWASAHDSRLIEYKKVGGLWWPSGYSYSIGLMTGANTAGGNDFDSQGRVYATGDYLQAGPQTIYGFQSLPCTGGNVTNSALRDVNGVYTFSDKMEIGDIEIACSSPCAKPPSGMVVWFPFDELTGIFADNIAGNPNGTYTNGPISVPGMVFDARNFNGANQYVDAPSAANINFGVGNFSIDAWIQMAPGGATQVIVDKRLTTTGFALGAFGGQLTLVLNDGGSSSFSVPGAPGFIADGNWHHVAASVTRNSVTGLLLFVDGVAATFDPTPRSLSISNTAPLRVGGPCPGFPANLHFRGRIDEVELFNRALTAAEVQAIYNAGKSGKCHDSAQAALLTYCSNQSVLAPTQTVCNYGPAPQSYNWSLTGPLTGPGCTLLSPITFTPAAGTVTVGPGSCVSVPPINSSIVRPLGLVPGQTSCYQLSATNTSSGATVTSQGKMGAINLKCFTAGTAVNVSIGHIFVPIGISKTISWGVTNTSDPNSNIPYKIQIQTDGDPDQQALRLNGLPPGTRYIGNLTVPPGGTGTIPVEVSALFHEPFEYYQIILFLDVDGDGTLDPVDAIEARTYAGCGTRPAGDVDGDGLVNSGDITAFVSILMSGLYDSLAPDPWCAADVTTDAAVNGRDVQRFTQMMLGQ